MDYRQIKAIEKANKGRILKVCPTANEKSGIYILTREEDGFKFAYIGQAKHILTRLAQHLSGYQHIDLSIKKHGLWSESNPTGWGIDFIECEESQLDEMEQRYIKEYASQGFQLRNATTGSQGKGKKDIADNPRKGYQAGLKQGYENARKDIKHLFGLHLDYMPKKNPPTKLQEKAVKKFEEFIE